ncbi:tRNA uridine-5-carboxymethylaminomethyl(34) synthesis GTPase MnmE [Aureimonas psammosilenae]|uniref:tRNA uridine-5-carboxymethylaminomethyl(34) synthesis GTPase MnmE n=1 Tax=Aureimonas psammosilenae TaxID=2495496 RepID=UPI0012612F7C|nr:tRNA uridine-5-carboxymethylaminomethyl(34) synthesis GTPase MnmE [Aureimonas psammosilenae]
MVSAANNTIAALSSGALPAGIAVLRVSGPATRLALEALAGGVPEPRRASLRTIRNGKGEEIDRGLVLFFAGPHSVSGEDLAEFHLHGGRAVVAAALEALTALPGIRLAEAGEFTRRAFLNGRIDLTEAEGLADLLAAETESQRRQALAQAGGALRALYEGWANRLLRARALLEASFDFSDEGDVSENVAGPVADLVGKLIAEMAAHLDGARGGEILRHGFRVAIVGAPNAGKSTLLNALADRDAAIVTDIPGTTRDVIEVVLDLRGVPVRLFDTAGLRDTEDTVERIGISRAREAMNSADLVLALEAPDAPLPTELIEAEDARPILRLRTKSDASPASPDAFALSARTGQGMEELVNRIAALASDAAPDPGRLVPARTRHREAVAAALAILTEFQAGDRPAEIGSEFLRLAGDELGRLTGRTGVEDLLGVVFSEFCIGK